MVHHHSLQVLLHSKGSISGSVNCSSNMKVIEGNRIWLTGPFESTHSLVIANEAMSR